MQAGKIDLDCHGGADSGMVTRALLMPGDFIDLRGKGDHNPDLHRTPSSRHVPIIEWRYELSIPRRWSQEARDALSGRWMRWHSAVTDGKLVRMHAADGLTTRLSVAGVERGQPGAALADSNHHGRQFLRKRKACARHLIRGLLGWGDTRAPDCEEPERWQALTAESIFSSCVLLDLCGSC